MTHPFATRLTLANPCTLEGQGLFTAKHAALTLRPTTNTTTDSAGLRIHQPDAIYPATTAHLTTTPVHPAFARMSPRHTSLAARDGAPPIFTVEHLLAALVGLGITDAEIEIDGPEVPIFDGSALAFADAIQAAGSVPITDNADNTPVRIIEPTNAIHLGDEHAFIRIEPTNEPTPAYHYELDYAGDPRLPPSTARWNGTPADFIANIAPARTFSLEEEAKTMHAAGLFTHLTPRDMLVLGDAGPIDNTLRFEDEPARHKLLDLIGDLALAGGPILAKITARRSGHALNQQAARELAKL